MKKETTTYICDRCKILIEDNPRSFWFSGNGFSDMHFCRECQKSFQEWFKTNITTKKGFWKNKSKILAGPVIK